jgi:hypothetical protein
MPEVLKVPEVAAELGCSQTRVRELCDAGLLKGAKHTNEANRARGEWQIPASAIPAYREWVANEPTRKGPKRKTKG